MDTTLWIIAAAGLVAVIALLAYRYRQEQFATAHSG